MHYSLLNYIMHSMSFLLCLTVCNPGDCSPPSSSVYGISQAKTMGVGCHVLLQGTLLTQESNPHLLN